MVSLRLVYLYSARLFAEFYSLRAGVSDELSLTQDFKNLDQFVYFLEIGNYANALNSIGRISPVHKSILSQIEDSHLEETCKMIDLCYEDFDINDVVKILGVEKYGSGELEVLKGMVDGLFESKVINWKILADNSVFKRTFVKEFLQNELIIGEMIDFVQHTENIY